MPAESPPTTVPTSLPDRRFPFIVTGAERAFRVGDVRLREDGMSIEATMTTGRWCTTPDGYPTVGSLGVLTDVMLGYIVVYHRPEGHWATSQEIHYEQVGPVPADGSVLTATGRLVIRGERSSLAQGEIVDSTGRLIAVASQRLRYIPGTPAALESPDHDHTPAAPAAPADPVVDGHAIALLEAELEDTEAGARLAVPLGPAARNPMGTLHGGIHLCASEIVGLRALTGDGGSPLTTSSLHINYIRPGPTSGSVTFEATRIHRGRSVGVAEVMSRTAEGKVCSRATVTAHLP